MDVNRRDVLRGAGLASAALSAPSLSACSPADTFTMELPGRFFAKAALGRLVEAKQYLDKNPTLSLVTSEGAQLFTGADDVAEAVGRLLTVEGFSMIGDKQHERAVMGGMLWNQLGPWWCSDMLKGDVVELDPCGTGALMSTVLNVFVGLREELNNDRISRVLVLENRALTAQMIEAVSFGGASSRVFGT